MNVRRVLLLALLLAGLLVFSACGEPSGGEEPAAGEGGKVSLRLWTHQNNAFNAGYEALIAAYLQENPNVEITLETFDYDLYIQTLQTAMPAGEEADILQLFGTWTAQYAERLAPAPDSVMSVEAARNMFYGAPIGGFIVDGQLYGLPQEFNLEYGGVLVNKTKFEAAGVTYPPQWAAMDDVLADALALSEIDDAGVMTTAGFHFTASDPSAFAFLAGIKQRGGDYWNADKTGFTFNTPEAKATLQWMVDAVEAGAVDPIFFNDEENWVGDAFFEGRVGIGYIGAWAIAEGRANYPDFGDEWDYAWLPSAQGDPLFVADSGWGLAVSPNSAHQDVAWDFVKFVAADPGNARQWNIASGTIPALPEVAESAEIAAEMPWVSQALGILPSGEYLGNMPDRDLIVYDIVYPHLLNALQGIETIDDALEAMDAEANATF
ncbi:MAG: extracellular solute-binding protein [Anaerolineae bacterium]|nr:extracellular solute-binding protein [Anaerolineae bacterium]